MSDFREKIIVDTSGNTVSVTNNTLDVNMSDEFGNYTSVQHPLPTNGDSVYEKDVWQSESISTDWVDTDATGLDPSVIPFTDLHTRITNSEVTTGKTLMIHFNRSIYATQVGLGCVGGDDFSNVKITLLGSGNVERLVSDNSADNTKYTSRNYKFKKQELFNAIKLEFITTDTVCLSNITIQKVTEVSLAQIDKTTNSLKVVDYSHSELHSGTHYFARSYITLGNGEVADLLIISPDTTKWAHMVFAGDGEAEILAEIYEGPTYSDIGVRDNERNRNRNYPDNNTTFIYQGAVITDPGDLLAGNVFGSGKNVGGGGRDDEEIILKQNTAYLFRVTNNTVSNNNVNWRIDWYEHTNVEE